MASPLKKYERHVLIGLVVLLLASFSITGVFTFCEERGLAPGSEAGGTFEPVKGVETEIDDEEFWRLHQRRSRFVGAVGWPTLENYLFPVVGSMRRDNPYQDTWTAIVGAAAAEAAGIVVGPDQLATAIRDVVGRRSSMRGEATDVTNAAYQAFLRDEFRGGTRSEFESELRAMLRRDIWLRPLVLTASYAVPYEAAYADWKRDEVQIDLDLVALSAAPFAERVESIERTRERISEIGARLGGVAQTARSLEFLKDRAERAHKDRGAWPVDFEALAGDAPGLKDTRDAWDRAPRYAVTGEQIDLRSAGPNGTFDDHDDVTLDVLAALRVHGALKRVGDELATWRTAAEAWPEDLAGVLKKPRPDRVPTISKESELDDPWGRRLVFVRPEGDGPARLTSLGADGQSDSPDDVSIEVTPDGARVVPAGVLAGLVTDADRDAWDRPFDVELENGVSWTWKVVSRGPDGVAGNEDDVSTGNELDVRAVYADDQVRQEIRTPATRRFELIYVHLPLLDDATLQKLWERFPDQRPATESEVFAYWHSNRDPGYWFSADDPADPETGYGAARLKQVAPDAPRHQVPGPTAFPERIGPEDPVVAPEGEDAEAWATYKEKGWRGIALRDLFVERILAHLLNTARESADAVAAWETEHRGKPEGADVPPRPEAVTFADLYARHLADLQPSDEARAEGAKTFVHHIANEPLTDDAWETNPDFGGAEIRRELDGLRSGDRYAPIPTQIGLRTTKAIVHHIATTEPRVPPLESVRDIVFAKYLERRRLDYAAERLEGLRTAAAAEADAASEGSFDRAVASWSEGLGGVAILRDRTGWFLGGALPVQETIPDDASDEEKARLRRINAALRDGFDTVARTNDGLDDADPAPGKLGREILRDRDGGTAILVRVADVRFGAEGAFSPAQYVRILQRKAYGEGGRGDGEVTPGTVQTVGEQFLAKFDWLRRVFGIRTNTDLDAMVRR